MRRGRTLGGG